MYARGDFVTGHPVLPQATEPPAPGHSQLVTNERRIVQQPMKGNTVIVACHQCGHVGPALVSKVLSCLVDWDHFSIDLKISGVPTFRLRL